MIDSEAMDLEQVEHAAASTETPEPTVESNSDEEAKKLVEAVDKNIAKPSAPAQFAEPKPAYQPNYKLRVMEQEKEIPERFRNLMKDAESEKEVRELFEKAYGLDFAKPKHEETRQNYVKLQSEHNFLTGSIQELRDTYSRGDMDTFFQKLSIPPEKVLQWAVGKVNYEQLPPEQKELIDARRNAELQNLELQKQNSLYQRQVQEQVVQARRMLLDSELARPEVKSMVDSFDQRFGKPGAFVQEVINRGQLAWIQSQGKVDLTPGQAVEQVLALYGLKNQAPASATPQTTAQVVQPSQQATTTIPNVGGGKSTSPVKMKPRSIDDLKKLREAYE